MSAADLLNDVLVDIARTAAPPSPDPLTAMVVDATLTTMAEAKGCIEHLAAENTVLREENNRLRELVACYRAERAQRT